jgi:formate dehydrogenase subunit gamma
MTNGQARVPRFDFAERAVHWMVAIMFCYAALSGLAMWSQKLYWLAWVLGGGIVVRGWHPWGGVLFAFGLAMMLRRWASQMVLDADDKIWLGQMKKYMTNDESGMPESGRFNAGQKMLFWSQAVLALLLLASGVVLWLPEWMPRPLRLAAVLVHPLAAIGAIGGIILHVYMGTAAVPGSLRAMVRGWVTPRWAASHHGKWHREMTRR